jgi:hypothetical protein
MRTVLRTGDPALNASIERALEEVRGSLVAGPILESAPAFEAGRSVAELSFAGVLSPAWQRDPFPQALPARRPLYSHQDVAIEKAASGRNLVVATGTGSGKTETFLVPILDQLLRQRDAGTLGPGVRALLLYPMNALANDQLKRLRALLHDEPRITFGRYTGETPQRRRDGLERLARQGITDVPRNEQVSREEMQAQPPHLLLTNYAMLEYLLMRPDDSPLFEVRDDHTWRFVVLDEIHTYDGTSGLEVSMLLRRLYDRSGRSPADVCAIGTSATVSGGPGDLPLVAAFGTALFGAAIEYEPGDHARQDVVALARPLPTFPGEPVEADLKGAADVEDDEQRGLTLARDPHARRLIQLLAQRPVRLSRVAAELFPGDSAAVRRTVDLLQLLARSRLPGRSLPLLDARYHIFLRAVDGAQVCLRAHEPDGVPFVTLEQHRDCPRCLDAPLSELATCRRCGQWHLRGGIGSADGLRKLQRAIHLEDSDSAVKFLAFVDEPAEPDEEGAVEPAPAGDADTDGDLAAGHRGVLCVECLSLGEPGPACGHGPASMRPFAAAERRKGSGAIICVNCGTSALMSGPRRLRLGNDAPPAVLASALYDGLPPGEDGTHRKFLSFSDSRQDAAFFAHYLERTYDAVQRRRLILATVRRLRDANENLDFRVKDIARPLEELALERGYFSDPGISQLERKNTVMSWLVAEVTSLDRRQSLHGVGLLQRRLVRPASWHPPDVLLQPPWSLTGDEAWLLMETLLLMLLDRAIVAMPEGVDPGARVFHPRTRQAYIRRDTADTKTGTEAWLPASDRVGSARFNYLCRVLEAGGSSQTGTRPAFCLRACGTGCSATRRASSLRTSSDRTAHKVSASNSTSRCGSSPLPNASGNAPTAAQDGRAVCGASVPPCAAEAG